MNISAQQTERALALQRSCFVADAHYDLLNLLAAKHIEGGRRGVIAADYLPRWREAGLNLIVSSIYLDDVHVPEMALRRALDQISCLHDELDDCDEIALCRSAGEIRDAVAAGKVAILLSFEGVEPLGSDLRLLRVFYELGVRGVGLVWSRRNAVGDGCFFSPRVQGQRGGLTDFGVQLLAEAERLGMYIDVAHLNDEGFADVCEFAKKPFISSHTNCRALTDVARNMSDEMLRTLASHGGMIGLNSCSSFVRLVKDGPSTARELAAHAAHIRELVGAEHLMLGLDFCDEIRLAKSGGKSNDCIAYYDHLYELTASLLEVGFSEVEVKGVLGDNLLGFLEKAIG